MHNFRFFKLRWTLLVCPFFPHLMHLEREKCFDSSGITSGFSFVVRARGDVIRNPSMSAVGGAATWNYPALWANPFVASLCVYVCVFRERREEESLVSEWVCDGKELSARSTLIGEERESRSRSGCEAKEDAKAQPWAGTSPTEWF